jgi:hypothetical protein
MEASLCRSRRGYCIGRVSLKEMQGLGVAERVYMSHILYYSMYVYTLFVGRGRSGLVTQTLSA